MANPYVKSAAQSAQNFYNTLAQQQQTEFAGQQNALNAINNMWSGVISTGAIPYGYSPQLDNLLQSNVINTGTQAGANAANAAALQQKQAAGGANVLPTGANAQINALIGSQTQQNIASGLRQEKIAGYQQGLSNLEGATNAELGVAKTEAPTEGANAALGANKAEEEAGAEIFKEAQATGPLAIASSIIGDVANGAKAITGIGDVASMFQNTMSSDNQAPGGGNQSYVDQYGGV